MYWLLLVAGVAALGWLYYRRAQDPAPNGPAFPWTVLYLLAGFAFCAWSYAIERQRAEYLPPERTLALAIAFDLSPSMLAIPDPAVVENVLPRYVRAVEVLLQFLEILEQRGETVFVSVSGFTRESQVLMGWDRSTSQVREIMRRTLSPEVFTTSGTSLEAATASLTDLFGMLPEELRNTSRRVAVIASDGEDTMPPWSLGYAVSGVENSAFALVALQSGLLDTAEGVPQFDEFGEFRGFRFMSGRQHTIPDAAIMSTLAQAPERGLYLRAEDPSSVNELLQFSGYSVTEGALPDQRLAAMLGMFAVVALLCARLTS